jgi:opacity protein-like surface antigen
MFLSKRKGWAMLKKAALTGLGLLFSIAAVASEEVLPDELPIQWASIITLSGGVGWATAGQNQYLYPFPLPSYQYFTYNSDTSTMGSGEVFFGLQKPLPVYPNILGELGLGIAYMTDATVTGYANVDGTLNAYAYTYKVNHGRLELKGRLIGYTIQPVQPYISGSLGVAFNNAHAYRPTLLIPSVSYPLQFVSNSTVAFPYTLGAGIQAKLDPHWLVAAGYQFADLGKSFLNGDGTYLSKGLRLTHFYTNEALLSISYTFS